MKRSNEPSSARWITRGVLGVVGAQVAEAEALRHLGVELDRAHLPGAAERVGHVQVDLRAVERAVALVHHVLEPAPLERVASAASVKSHSSSVPSLFSGRVESSTLVSSPNSS